MNNAFKPKSPWHFSPRTTAAVVASAVMAGAHALPPPVPTDISDTPLIVTNAAQVKPNVMLLMDNSGSMGRTHMPDEVESITGVKSIGYKSAQCNALYYNPATKYILPKKYDGSSFPRPTFGAAAYAGYVAFFAAPDLKDSSVTDLNSGFVAYDWGKFTVLGPAAAPTSGPSAGFAAAIPGPAFYYVYTGPQVLTYRSAACTQLDTGASVAATGGGSWTRVDLRFQPALEQAKFALWYSFYRTRIAMTKSAASLAFLPLDASKRVGFITVEPKDQPTDATINQSRYLQIGDFSTVAAGQKEQWYKKLFSQTPSGASPAREGLARVGRYYGGETDGINGGMGGPDPVQYACQQNFTILTSDGYWNGQTESPGGGGVKLNRDGATLVGQQDGDPTCTSLDPYCVRPMYDGNSSDIQKVTDKDNTYTQLTCALDAIYRRTEQQQKQIYNLSRDTTRTQQETIQYRQSSTQLVASSVQTVKTVKQNSKTVDQYFIETDTPTQSRYQVWKSQDKIVRDTEQFQLQTKQQTAQTLQNVEVIFQTRAHEEQWQTASSQYVLTTTQFQTSTINYTEGKQQVYKRQWQWIGIRGTDAPTPPLQDAGNCPVGYTCAQYDSFAKDVVDPATCPLSNVSGFDPDPTLSYVHTECTAGPLTVASRAVAACSAGVTPGTPDPARLGNSWVTTTCNAATSTPVFAPGYTVGTCLPSSQMLGFPYTITTCSVVQNSATPQSSACVPGPATTDSGPSFITTQCVQPVATNYAARNAPPCDETSGPQTNQITFTTTTCTKTRDALVPSPLAGFGCTDDPGTGGAYLKVTCGLINPISSTTKSINSCTRVTSALSNSYTETQCVQTPVFPIASVTAVPFGTCAPGPNGGLYAYDTVCDIPAANNQTVFVASATCGGTTSTTPAVGPPWIDRICSKPAGTNQLGVAWNPTLGTCPNDDGLSPPYARSTCTTVPVGGAPVAVDQTTCTATTTDSSPPYVTTHCVTQGVGGSFVCPGTPPLGPPWIYEVCGSNATFANAPYGSCTPGSSAGLAANQICRETVSPAAPIDVCADDLTPSGTNPRVTCSGPVVIAGMSGPTDPALCPAVQGPQGGPQYYDITCATAPFGTFATPAGVAACPTPALNPTTFELTTCSNPIGTNFTNDSAPCAVIIDPGQAGNGYTTTQCSKSDVYVNMPASVCNGTILAQSGSGPEVKCVPNGGDAAKPVDSCRVGTTDGADPYDTITACNSTQGSAAWNNDGPAICVAGRGSVVGEEFDCRTFQVGPDVLDPTCANPTGPDSSGIIVTCPHISGSGYHYTVATTTTVTRTPMSRGNPSGRPIVSTGTSAAAAIGDACYASAQTVPSLPNGTFPPKPPVDIVGCSNWACTESIPSTGGSLNSLADVAQYYYTTDLRPLMADAVLPAGVGPEDDTAPHQHMTTFTIALGVAGTLKYQSDYRTATTGDFADIRSGVKDWPVWPDPNLTYANVADYDNAKSIDDFWHTAVNGRGRFFSASDPTTVVQGLAEALAKVGAVTAAGAADAISSLQPTPGNNFVYGTSYESGTWSGEMQAFTIDTVSGVVSAQVPGWSAQTLLDGRTFPKCDNRKIFLIRGGNSLVDFAWNTDECPPNGVPTTVLVNTPLLPAEMSNFLPSKVALLSQFTAYAPTDPQLLAAQAPGVLVNFLRGQTGNDGFIPDSLTKLFRQRSHVLGDLVDSQPVYVKQPFANYVDSGYTAFKTTGPASTRPAMVYVGGNDGMLHAFYATVDTTNPTFGQEAWAVIPSEVLPQLYQLADANYDRGGHKFFVDGTPVASDVYDGAWHTILVGGLNAGGKGYYALDITDPTAPAALWEFRQNSGVCPGSSAAALDNKSDCNMGLSFGKPVITKLNLTPGGPTWVVMFTSGYNNLNGVSGDGEGFLYVVNAMTGKTIYKIGTSAGSGTIPSGLAQINNYVDNVLLNNLTARAYGGDLLGNVWRFEFGLTPKAVLIGTAQTGVGRAQPITTRPELAELNGDPFVLVGTGQLLGLGDVIDTETQSVYGLHDHLSSSPAYPVAVYPSLRGALQTLTMTASGGVGNTGTGVGAIRNVTCTANCARTDGWVVNLPEPGERVNVDMKLVLGTLAFASNVPEGIPCSVGGHSWFNQFDFRTGLAVLTAPLANSSGIISTYLANSLSVGFNPIELQPGPNQTNPSYGADLRQGTAGRINLPIYVAPPPFVGKRISWREIVVP